MSASEDAARRRLAAAEVARAPAGSLPPKPLAWSARSHPGAKGSARRAAALSYDENANVMIVGVGLMGQYLAKRVGGWLGAANPSLEVVAETVDVTSEDAVSSLFSRHDNIRYLQHTAGISPKPLTPPEELGREDVLGACQVNLWGALNVLKQGIRAGAFAPRTHGVILLSTSATVGSEGRASAAYEASKGGLVLQARYFLEAYGLVLNGLAPHRCAASWQRRTRSARDACKRWRTACRPAA